MTKIPNRNYRAYNTWNLMKQRCNNPNVPAFKNYGARGITYDPKWETFEGFLSDMGERPEGDYVIDRIDPNDNYQKDNCRWITRVGNTRRASKKHGQSLTKEYKAARTREYYARNKEKERARIRVWRAANPDKIAKHSRDQRMRKTLEFINNCY